MGVPIRQTDGEKMGIVTDFIVFMISLVAQMVKHYFLWPKITADGDFSHEIKRWLLPGRKVMTNLNSILKNRNITLLTKVPIVKAMAFPVVMYGCESWTIKKAEY